MVKIYAYFHSLEKKKMCEEHWGEGVGGAEEIGGVVNVL